LHEKTKLLFVGRLSVQKNIPQLLGSLEGISDQFETHIVGNGALEHDLKLLVKNLRLHNIIFHGRKDGNDLIKLYRESDIFLLPSNREGMPLVLLEAMAMSLPIIATKVTGNRDVVMNNKNGLLVPLNDIVAFRNSLLKIKTDKNCIEK